MFDVKRNFFLTFHFPQYNQIIRATGAFHIALYPCYAEIKITDYLGH